MTNDDSVREPDSDVAPPINHLLHSISPCRSSNSTPRSRRFSLHVLLILLLPLLGVDAQWPPGGFPGLYPPPWTTASAADAGAGAAGPEVASRPPTKRRVAKLDGDILIGALFPVHRQPSMNTAYTRQCGEIWEQYGMHRIEIFLRTIDEINNNPHILPNITLGCDIRDSCWYPPVALEQSIDFIKNSIASLEKLNASGGAGAAASGQHGPPGAAAAVDGSCVQRRDKPIAGLIGPGSSTVTVQVQNLLSLFNIPQIGYSSTSKDLSDKSLYTFFLRVVPSDKLQARALVDFVLHFNWTFISTVYTEGNYGFSGIQEFSLMAREAGICEATSDKVSNNADDNAFNKVIDNLNKTPNARVVICFCEGMTIRGLVSAARRRNLDGYFMFIGSDGWGVRPDVVENIEEWTVGGVSMKLYSPPIADFDEYYFRLRPESNARNPWFVEFWQDRFKCYIPGDDRDERYQTPCTGDEDVSKGHIQDAKLGFVVNAIYTMAYALDAMHRDVCGRDSVGLCDAMSPVNGTLFLHYLLNASFLSYSNDPISFDQAGDPPARYEIMNYQKTVVGDGGVSINGTSTLNDSSAAAKVKYDYVRIGGWADGNLTIDDNLIYWPSRGARFQAPPVESYCSRPCPHGQIKQLQQLHCCWVCIQCQPHEYMVDERTCKPCALGWFPNPQLTACIMNEIERLKWTDVEAVLSISFACLGLLATAWVTFVFCRHNNTPVVKASTRELSYIILFGIALAYSATFPLVAKPSPVACFSARVIPGIAFALIYGALVTKTNRIARILAGSKKKIMTRKPRFMSASAQVVITGLIVAAESAIVAVSLTVYGGADSALVYPARHRTRLACSETAAGGVVLPFGFDALLIAMCTLYAVKTRNLPENFNEAKFIGFTMYTTCIIWIAFVPLYFGSDNKVITKCMTISSSASVALVLLFLPKIYIIIYRPEKNNRSAFTTAKGVRCHIGTGAGFGQRSLSTSGDSMDSTRITSAVSPACAAAVATGYNPWKSAASGLHDYGHGHHDRSESQFESAAHTVRRQWNILGRWKSKQQQQPGEGGGRHAAVGSLQSSRSVDDGHQLPRHHRDQDLRPPVRALATVDGNAEECSCSSPTAIYHPHRDLDVGSPSTLRQTTLTIEPAGRPQASSRGRLFLGLCAASKTKDEPVEERDSGSVCLHFRKLNGGGTQTRAARHVCDSRRRGFLGLCRSPTVDETSFEQIGSDDEDHPAALRPGGTATGSHWRSRLEAVSETTTTLDEDDDAADGCEALRPGGGGSLLHRRRPLRDFGVQTDEVELTALNGGVRRRRVQPQSEPLQADAATGPIASKSDVVRLRRDDDVEVDLDERRRFSKSSLDASPSLPKSLLLPEQRGLDLDRTGVDGTSTASPSDEVFLPPPPVLFPLEVQPIQMAVDQPPLPPPLPDSPQSQQQQQQRPLEQLSFARSPAAHDDFDLDELLVCVAPVRGSPGGCTSPLSSPDSIISDFERSEDFIRPRGGGFCRASDVCRRDEVDSAAGRGIWRRYVEEPPPTTFPLRCYDAKSTSTVGPTSLTSSTGLPPTVTQKIRKIPIRCEKEVKVSPSESNLGGSNQPVLCLPPTATFHNKVNRTGPEPKPVPSRPKPKPLKLDDGTKSSSGQPFAVCDARSNSAAVAKEQTKNVSKSPKSSSGFLPSTAANALPHRNCVEQLRPHNQQHGRPSTERPGPAAPRPPPVAAENPAAPAGRVLIHPSGAGSPSGRPRLRRQPREEQQHHQPLPSNTFQTTTATGLRREGDDEDDVRPPQRKSVYAPRPSYSQAVHAGRVVDVAAAAFGDASSPSSSSTGSDCAAGKSMSTASLEDAICLGMRRLSDEETGGSSSRRNAETASA